MLQLLAARSHCARLPQRFCASSGRARHDGVRIRGSARRGRAAQSALAGVLPNKLRQGGAGSSGGGGGGYGGGAGGDRGYRPHSPPPPHHRDGPPPQFQNQPQQQPQARSRWLSSTVGAPPPAAAASCQWLRSSRGSRPSRGDRLHAQPGSRRAGLELVRQRQR